MKKISLFIFSLLLTVSAHAQFNGKEFLFNSFELGENNKAAENTQAGGRAAFDTIYYQPFADSLPAGWLAVDSAGFCNWKWTNLGPQGQYSSSIPLNSTTKANGYMILDGDFCNSGGSGNILNAFLQSPAINLSGISGAKVLFQHRFRYCCSTANARFEVQVSTDSINWAIFDVKGSVVANTQTANPVMESVNISSVAANQPKVWIRFYETGASHYFWMIDDVAIVEAPENDIKLTNASFGDYSAVPLGQQQPIAFSGTITNEGAKAQNNVKLNVNVNNGAFLFNSVPTVLSASESKDDTTTTSFLPVDKGTYSILFTAMQDEPDAVPSNNVKAVLFAITDSIYSQDNNTYSGSGWWNGTKKPYEIGSAYEIIKNAKATSISFVLHGTTTAGALVKVKLYEISDSATTFTPLLVGASNSYTVLSADRNTSFTLNPKVVTLPLITPVLLKAGNFYLAMVENISDGINEVAIASGTDLLNTFYILFDPVAIGPKWSLRAGASAMVRLNVNPSSSISIKENSLNAASVIIYPNPTSGNSNLTYELAASSDVTLKVFDVTGKEVLAVTEGSKPAGKHLMIVNTSSLNSGVYYYTLSVNDNNITKKLVVVK